MLLEQAGGGQDSSGPLGTRDEEGAWRAAWPSTRPPGQTLSVTCFPPSGTEGSAPSPRPQPSMFPLYTQVPNPGMHRLTCVSKGRARTRKAAMLSLGPRGVQSDMEASAGSAAPPATRLRPPAGGQRQLRLVGTPDPRRLRARAPAGSCTQGASGHTPRLTWKPSPSRVPD